MVKYLCKRILTMLLSTAFIVAVTYLMVSRVSHGRFDIRLRENLWDRYVSTMFLTLTSTAVSMLAGIPMGVTCAVHRNRRTDHILSTLVFILYAIPTFILSIYAILIFALKLKLVPVFGRDGWNSFLLPIGVLACSGMATLTKMTRSAVLDVMNRQFVKVLRSKGLKERDILYHHVLRNSAPTVLAAVSNTIVQCFCGSMIVEIIFAIPGLGRSMINAIIGGNMAVLLAGVAMLSMTLMGWGIAMDLTAAAISPRMRAACISGKRDE